MTPFAQPVSRYMTRDPEWITADTDLRQVLRVLNGGRYSALPVVDAAGAVIGVLSRTDLLRLGLLQSGARGASPSLPMPHRMVTEIMTQGAHVITADASLQAAAQSMIGHQIHRLMVVEDGRLVGVISTLDLAAAVRDAGVEAPISSRMSAPVVTVDAGMPISAANELLASQHISAVVVEEHGWPIGVFAQIDALACRDLPRGTPVGTMVDPAMICLPSTTRMFRAAAHAAQLDVRRVIACEDRQAVGVLGGLDFAKVVADG